MKNVIKNLGLLGLTLCLVSTAEAAIGPRLGAGLSFPTVSVANVAVPGLSTKTGFVGGLGFEQSFGPVGVVADLLYTKRVAGFPANISAKLSYLEIPVMAQLSLLGFRLAAGGYYGVGLGNLTSCNGTACTSVAHTASNITVGTATLNFNKNDMGLMFGAGYALPIPMLTVAVDLRFRLGLSNIADVAGVNVKWRGVDIVAGVLF